MTGRRVSGSQSTGRGRVVLVGAGPGDPDLLTLRAVDAIARCDALLYDALVSPEIVARARPGALVVRTGKRGGGASMAQHEIERIAIQLARRGLRVVRLKGGDPFVFGRGGEEIEALERAGVAWEIIPGVSSGTAAAVAAGIPLTHRAVASSVAFVTAEEAEGRDAARVDWEALSAGADTLVVFMCARRPAAAAARLVAAGRPPSTPVALVSRATLADQTVYSTTLGALATSHDLSVPAPALAIVGEVAALPTRRSGAAWHDDSEKEVDHVENVA
jgi:uroporphyrin-III C-methyltransferase